MQCNGWSVAWPKGGSVFGPGYSLPGEGMWRGGHESEVAQSDFDCLCITMYVQTATTIDSIDRRAVVVYC